MSASFKVICSRPAASLLSIRASSLAASISRNTNTYRDSPKPRPIAIFCSNAHSSQSLPITSFFSISTSFSRAVLHEGSSPSSPEQLTQSRNIASSSPPPALFQQRPSSIAEVSCRKCVNGLF
eukprot:TRINITY_DN2092_c0_g1_i3.p1 TRINITY_DN2092_c0_g1~~TRINITY_DN2092_c0_g1_i3.p1  ORF type:complete len:123 (-),score=14.63 TRINITY_DN2092_c0_g1_i3:46-414(-)